MNDPEKEPTPFTLPREEMSLSAVADKMRKPSEQSTVHRRLIVVAFVAFALGAMADRFLFITNDTRAKTSLIRRINLQQQRIDILEQQLKEVLTTPKEEPTR